MVVRVERVGSGEWRSIASRNRGVVAAWAGIRSAKCECGGGAEGGGRGEERGG